MTSADYSTSEQLLIKAKEEIVRQNEINQNQHRMMIGLAWIYCVDFLLPYLVLYNWKDNELQDLVSWLLVSHHILYITASNTP